MTTVLTCISTMYNWTNAFAWSLHLLTVLWSQSLVRVMISLELCKGHLIVLSERRYPTSSSGRI